MTIRSKAATAEYRANFDAIFKKAEPEKTDSSAPDSQAEQTSSTQNVGCSGQCPDCDDCQMSNDLG